MDIAIMLFTSLNDTLDSGACHTCGFRDPVVFPVGISV
jgi:hypothetical protein